MGVEEIVPNQTPITKEFLEKILKSKVLALKVSAGSNPGDNFLSVLISLEVILADDVDQPLHLLFKTFPSHPTRQKLLEDTNLFLKEYQVYDEWLPALINFQKDVIGNDKILLPAMPEMVAGKATDYTGNASGWEDLDPMLSNFVMMVDVRKTYGFQMANKLKSLGYYHVKVVLEELAKYHALGHAYRVHHKLTSVLSKFPFMEDPFFCSLSLKPTLETMIKMNMQLVEDSCSEFLEGKPEIKESLDKIKDPERAVDLLHKFLNPQGVDEEEMEGLIRLKPNQYSEAPLKDQWLVAGHGDCWTNNMLFKTDETGQVTKAILVDLQIARESCIMADIVYFLYTSTDTDFRNEYLNEMLALYHERFVHFCEVLKVKPFAGFSLENFMRKFHRSKIFGFLFASLVLPIILQRPETSVNMDNLEVVDQEKGISQADEWAEMFQKMGRDDDDAKLLRERFTKLFGELYEEGVF